LAKIAKVLVNHRVTLLLLLAAALLPQISLSQSWDRDHLGNHRAVVRVPASAVAVRAHIPWRRRDADPAQKNLIVVDARTGKEISNVSRININREFGDIAFEPVSGSGTYYVYYLPYVISGRENYPTVTYPEPNSNANPEWLAHLNSNQLPPAEFVSLESVDSFDQYTPMEHIATQDEVQSLLARHPNRNYFIFPEDRSLAIRMQHDLPQVWILDGPQKPFDGTADRGEFYAFQLGVWAARAPLSNVRINFSASGFRCFNQGGIDWQSHPFTRIVNVLQGSVQPFWCGVQVPLNPKSAQIETTLTLTAAGEAPTRIPFHLSISPKVIRNAGDDEPARLSRLRWLDSTLAVDDDTVAPYTAVQVHGRTVGVLGRQVALGAQGFPASIRSSFDIEMTHLSRTPRELLSAPVRLVIKDTQERELPWSGGDVRFTKQAAGVAAWVSHAKAGDLEEAVTARIEFDGDMEFSVALSASRSTSVSDVVLEIPLRNDVARYVMGLGLQGQPSPAAFNWKWDVKRNQDSAWIGDVNAGLQFSLHDEHYSRPLNTNFYQSKPLAMPVSWANNGNGGCRFLRRSDTYLIQCFSGPRLFQASEPVHYDFRLLLTPFHVINPTAHWKTRYYHAFKPVDEIAATGANTINVHHATEINPYINYPFLRPARMKAYIDQAHARGMKVKIYYTVRELTNHAPELVPLLSLGDEVLASGPGGGPSWLQEHLNGDYIPGWHVPELHDDAVVTTGISRWHNFYVEGLHWLVENVGIDGLYLDDVAFDRTTMERVRKVLLRGNSGAMIDLHSANQFDPRDGFASSANLYLEHFPYIDRLWFGEYFNYNAPPAYWLTEMSGIPFGLMGEMLQDGGNPWRGMLFGMTNRLPWSGDPRPIWKFWDENAIAGTKMLGWWVPSSPVKTGREDVLATVYQGKAHSIVALASWAKEPVNVNLQIDWSALGIDATRAQIRAGAIDKFQTAATFSPGQPIPVQPGKGWLLVLD
jgi:hypothetical protein